MYNIIWMDRLRIVSHKLIMKNIGLTDLRILRKRHSISLIQHSNWSQVSGFNMKRILEIAFCLFTPLLLPETFSGSPSQKHITWAFGKADIVTNSFDSEVILLALRSGGIRKWIESIFAHFLIFVTNLHYIIVLELIDGFYGVINLCPRKLTHLPKKAGIFVYMW